MTAPPLGRLRLLSLLIFALTAALVIRLFFLQIIRGDHYAERADRQYQRAPGQIADRGTIFFRQKDGQLVSAATMRDGFLLAINPGQLTNAPKVYESLNAILPLERELFLEKAGKADDPHEEIAAKLDQKTAERIKNQELPGVSVHKMRWRFYPARRAASHTLGLLNYQGVGTYGLEKYYETLLHRDRDKTFISFLSEVLSDFGGSLWGRAVSETEADLVLNLEPVVQNTLENELALIRQTWQSETVGGIVLEPDSGRVFAMAAWPDFDPGGRQPSIEPLTNPLVERVYEMGSIVKPLTLAAALDAGVITAKTTYEDTGTLFLGGRQISNFDGRARGVVSMQEVLNQSLNTGAVFAAQKLGRDRFRDYTSRYGLMEKTGIDLPGEIVGLTDNLNSRRDIEYATAAFGQGFAVTPITMARALAALANGGKLVQLQVVAKINYRNSKLSRELKPEVIRQVLKPETSREITRMLVEVVDSALVGGKYRLDKYQVAAKTGTAQQVRPGASGYDPDYFLHSFFGYFPASQPRFLVFLYQLRPLGARYASETLSESFMSLAKFLLNYYNVPPDR